MSDFINSIKPRGNAIQANSELLEKNDVVVAENTSIVSDNYTAKEQIEIKTDRKPNQALLSRLTKKVKSQLLTIRISDKRKEAIDELAKLHGTTRQEIINLAFDNIIEKLS